MNVLCVAAHPDDETLGCGGTLARHAIERDSVHVLFLATGVTARQRPLGTIPDLRRRALAAADALGVNPPTFLDGPDNRLDSVDRLDLVRRVENIVRAVEPAVVYTHHSGDRNVDHRATHDAVLTACRPLPGSGVHRLLAFEVPSSTEWGRGFEPNAFIDVHGEPVHRKLEALKCYGAEVPEFPHPRSWMAVLALAEWRGASCGRREAEAFMLVREVR